MTLEDMIKRSQVVDLKIIRYIKCSDSQLNEIFRLLLAKRLVDGVVVTAAITGSVPDKIFVKLATALQR